MPRATHLSDSQPGEWLPAPDPEARPPDNSPARDGVMARQPHHLRGTADEPAVAQETPIETRGEVRPVTSRERFAWWRRILAGLLGVRNRTRRDTTRECAPDPTAGESSAESGRWLAAEQTTPLTTVPQGEAARVAHALAALPDGQREAVVLRYHHGYSVAATAAYLGATPDTVTDLLYRGLQALRCQLCDNGDVP